MELIPGADTDPADPRRSSTSSPTGGSAKAWCRTRTRPTSSPTASAASSAAPSPRRMVEDDFTIEEVDALTGPLIGLPNSASFRLLDLVGLDVWAFVGSNLYDAGAQRSLARALPAARFREEDDRAQLAGRKDRPGLLQDASARATTRKSWRSIGRRWNIIPLQKPRFASVEAARNIEDLGERLRTLLRSDDRAGQFLWKLFSDLFLYSRRDGSRDLRPHRRDRSRHALGLRPQARAVRAVGRAGLLKMSSRAWKASAAPIAGEHQEDALARGANSLYRHAGPRRSPHTEYFDFLTNAYQPLEPRPASSCCADRQARARRGARRTPAHR